MFSKIIKRYKEKYLFEEDEDKEVVGHKNLVHMMRLLPVFIIFSGAALTIRIINSINSNSFNFYAISYYISLFATCIFGFVSSFVVRKRKSQYIIGLFISYTVVTLLICLSIFSIAKSDYYFNGYMTFAIVALLTVILFDVNPMFWITLIVISDFLIGFKTVNINNHSIFVNFVVLSVMVVSLCFWKRASTVRDLKQKRALVAANKKSEDLLLNILPKKVMEDLRETGKSSPEQYKNVSILFTDIVNFTETAKDLDPSVLISELNDIFGHFDQIVDKYSCTRIKTIGDAYLAVCGLPESDPNHAANLMNCAKEFVEYLKKRNETSSIKWMMRIGIHSGEVIAGIVGIHKYIYDIFGDAVNVASRVESLGESMKINISEETYKELQGQNMHFTTREIMDVKGKGKMQMYFVD